MPIPASQSAWACNAERRKPEIPTRSPRTLKLPRACAKSPALNASLPDLARRNLKGRRELRALQRGAVQAMSRRLPEWRETSIPRRTARYNAVSTRDGLALWSDISSEKGAVDHRQTFSVEARAGRLLQGGLHTAHAEGLEGHHLDQGGVRSPLEACFCLSPLFLLPSAVGRKAY